MSIEPSIRARKAEIRKAVLQLLKICPQACRI